jgi:hypothetical protein
MKMLRCFLGLGTPPNCRSGLTPKNMLEGESDDQIQLIPSNHNNNKHIEHKDLSRGSATPLSSAYILVVEVTTKVGVSFTSLPLSSNHKGQLEFFNKISRVIQTS